jgi:DNA-binding response OmpR family regulator
MNVLRRSILIVDDLETFASLLAASLSSNGYDVVCAFDYEKTIKIVNERDFDCVLLDYSLADERHTGIDIARHIREINRHTKIILMSGESNPKTIAHIESLTGTTIDHYIEKPFSVNELLQNIPWK